MSISTAETKQSFPFPYEDVFNGLLAVLGPAGYKVKSKDQLLGRILAAAPMSGFSWGEDIVIQVQRTGHDVVDLIVQSNLRVGFNLTAISKNSQNAERIIGALSHFLQHGGRDAQASIAAAPKANGSSGSLLLIGVFVLLVVLLPYILT